MLQIRPRNFTLVYGQLGAGIAAWGFLLVPLIVLAVAAFRPERSPETTQTLHDLGWMLLIMPFVPFTVQTACLGWAILQDNGTPPALPRWFGYFNLWVALSFIPGGVIPLFKTGPLAYNGVFAFWIPFSIFFVAYRDAGRVAPGDHRKPSRVRRIRRGADLSTSRKNPVRAVAMALACARPVAWGISDWATRLRRPANGVRDKRC